MLAVWVGASGSEFVLLDLSNGVRNHIVVSGLVLERLLGLALRRIVILHGRTALLLQGFGLQLEELLELLLSSRRGVGLGSGGACDGFVKESSLLEFYLVPLVVMAFFHLIESVVHALD